MGRLTRDPELRHTQNNDSVTSFTIAVDRRKEGCDFLDIVAWQKTAEFVAKYFRKGMPIIVSGRLQSRKFEHKDGGMRSVVEVIADEVFFAERKAQDAPNAVPGASQQEFTEIADDGDLPF